MNKLTANVWLWEVTPCDRRLFASAWAAEKAIRKEVRSWFVERGCTYTDAQLETVIQEELGGVEELKVQG